MKSGYIPTFGGRIYYELYGKDKPGIPLICMHGGPGGTHAGMKPLIPVSEDRPVLIYDQLGSGYSDRRTDLRFWTVENFVEELQEIRDYLGWDEVFLMGGSWGTMLATSYMIKKKPQGVKGLVLTASCLSAPMWCEDCAEYLKAMPQEMQDAVAEADRTGDYTTEGFKAANDEFTRRHGRPMLPWPPTPQKDPLLTVNRAIYMYMWGPSEFRATGTLKDFDVTPYLHTIDVPTYYTCGEFDTASPRATEYYASLMPNATFRVFKGAGHSHTAECTEEYNKYLREFLNSIDPVEVKQYE